MQTLHTLEEYSDIFTDAYLTDEDNSLLFVSLWGRDARVLELLARLTVGDSSMILRQLTVNADLGTQKLRVHDADRLSKSVAKTPKNTLFGCLANVWIYDSDCVEQLQHGSSARWYLTRDIDSLEMAITSDLVWRIVQAISPVPLLDAWRPTVMAVIMADDWLEHRAGYGIYGIRLSLPEDVFLSRISALVRHHHLELN